MTIQSPPCGMHCGISAGHTGHCDCELCHDGAAPVVLTRSDLLTVTPKAPMCDRWYDRAGNYRPWLREMPACECWVTAHTPPGYHGKGCPVRQRHDRELLAGSVMRVKLTAPVPVPSVLGCPECGSRVFLDAADPDDDLEAFWHHLGQHTQDPQERLRLWTAALNAGEGTSCPG